MRVFNRFCFLFFVLSGLTLTVLVMAQEVPPSSTVPVLPEELPEPVIQPLRSEPPHSPVIQPPLPRMNPMVLLRMKQQLTFELQQTQRTLGFIDPNDKQLIASLREQQTELTNQLKEINSQLKTQGIPIDNSVLEKEEPSADGLVPKTPNIVSETLPVGTLPPVDPNLILQRREIPATGLATPKETTPPISPFQPPVPPIPGIGITPAGNPINNPIESANHLPTPTSFDQDQAWSDSPWVPRPSKELTELKQTVDSLRKEITDLKENIKALEVQIQLLNRNILLSQPK